MRKPFFSWSCLGMGLFLVTGCASLQPEDFAKSSTHFELDRYFVGHARSWGVFENRDGAPRYSFVCDSYGKRSPKGLVSLHQDFRFSTGKVQTRDWQIRKIDSHDWEASASDMVGTTRGHGAGNAFFWEYNIALGKKNPLAVVHIKQWIYQIEGTDSLMTRLVISKLGVVLSEVSEVIHPVPDVQWSRE